MSTSSTLPGDPTLDDLIAERDRAEKRDHNLRSELRTWGRRTFGTVDAFAVVVAERHQCTVTFARECLYRPKSRPVLDTAIEIYQERTVGESAASEPAASEPAASEPAASEPAASEPAASEPLPTA